MGGDWDRVKGGTGETYCYIGKSHIIRILSRDLDFTQQTVGNNGRGDEQRSDIEFCFRKSSLPAKYCKVKSGLGI